MRTTTITATGAGRRDCARRGTDQHPSTTWTSSSPAERQAGFFVVRPPRRSRGRRRC